MNERSEMTDTELIQTLKIASQSVGDNIALVMLLTMAAERIQALSHDQSGADQ